MLIFSRETFIYLSNRLNSISTSKNDESLKILIFLSERLKMNYSFFSTDDADCIMDILIDINHHLGILFKEEHRSEKELIDITEIFFILEELEKKITYLINMYPLLSEDKKQKFIGL